MNKIEEKLKALLGERETIIQEMEELKIAFDTRQQRLVEITGSIKTINELLEENKSEENCEENATTD